MWLLLRLLQLAGGSVYKGDTGARRHEIMERLWRAWSASQAKESKFYPEENGKSLKDSVAMNNVSH